MTAFPPKNGIPLPVAEASIPEIPPPAIPPALAHGVARLRAWADLVDAVNVFPVADGDTGRNLAASLSPLRDPDAWAIRPERSGGTADSPVRRLLLSARGNSGNIAAAFFASFLPHVPSGSWTAATRAGRDAARSAVADPRPGTLLSFFDVLADTRPSAGPDAVIAALAGAVAATTDQLPELNRAGVVDAGALGLFLFFEGFWHHLSGGVLPLSPPTVRFDGRLTPRRDHATTDEETGHCVTALVRPAGGIIPGPMDASFSLDIGFRSVVSHREGDLVRVHFHADDPDEARRCLVSLGQIEDWREERLEIPVSRSVGHTRPERGQPQRVAPAHSDSPNEANAPVHLMTDAAASLTPADAERLGLTLLDSYIVRLDGSVPETLADGPALYAALRNGEKIATSQASVFERRHCYERALDSHGRVLYLCVGSAYTGNHAVASSWKRDRDDAGRFTVLDSGAASGRLGLSVMAVAGRIPKRECFSPEDGYESLEDMAFHILNGCRELVFLDRLRWLAASGRISGSGATAGDLLGLKPVISPLPGGAKKQGMVRSAAGQLAFALRHVTEDRRDRGPLTLLLQYTDNRDRIMTEVRPAVAAACPGDRIMIRPMSFTSGIHMGPGTWAVAWIPVSVAPVGCFSALPDEWPPEKSS